MSGSDQPRRWIRVLPRSRTIEQDVEAELRFHIDSRIAELCRQGLSPDAARTIAVQEFGSVGAAREELTRLDRNWTRRRARGFWWSDLGRDLRFAARGLIGRPGFAVSLLLTLGLGIGATVAMFTVVHASLFRPLPYLRPDRLVHLWETYANGAETSEASYPDFLDWRVQGGFAGVEGYDPTNITIGTTDGALFLRGARATAGLFELLGVKAALGRVFRPGEDHPGSSPVVVLTHEYWLRAFGGASSAIGQQITINGQSHEIVGVLPPTFHFAPAGDAELWLPLDRSEQTRAQRFNHWLSVVARLADGDSEAAARTRLNLVMQRLAAQYPETNSGRLARLVPLRTQISGDARPMLLSLFAAVALLLIIACVNVASLLLARAITRGRELGVRVALGASRARLLRQLVTESLLLSLLGAVLGWMAAAGTVPLLVSNLPGGLLDRMPYLRGLKPDLTAFGFTTGVALLVGLVLGVVPAAVSWSSVRSLLVGNAGIRPNRSRFSARDTLVAVELALTVVLLVSTGLAGRSLLRLMQQDPGFRSAQLITARIPLAGPRYQDGAEQQRFFEQLLEQVRQLPRVSGVGAVSNLPLAGGGTLTYRVDGQAEPPPSARWSVVYRGVGGDYFRVMAIPLVMGRAFAPQDDSTAQPAIVISQSLAERHFPNGDAVGQRFRFYAFPDSPWEIIGVVGDVKTARLDEAAPPTVYFSHLQGAFNRMTLVLATDADEGETGAELRAIVRRLDPGLPVHDVRTMEQVMAGSPAVLARRYPLLIMASFAGAALMLALVGVYGVVSYAVARRSRELAIRAALGAARRQLLLPVLGHGAVLAGVGIGSGALLAVAISRFLSGLLYGVSTLDWPTYLGVGVLLMLVTIVATLVPARRAASAMPATALQSE